MLRSTLSRAVPGVVDGHRPAVTVERVHVAVAGRHRAVSAKAAPVVFAESTEPAEAVID